MVHRKDGQHLISGADVGDGTVRHDDEADVPLGQHDALGPSGRAGGVDEDTHGIGVDGSDQVVEIALVPGLLEGAALFENVLVGKHAVGRFWLIHHDDLQVLRQLRHMSRELADQFLVDDEEARLRLFEDVLHVVEGQFLVDGHEHTEAAGDGEVYGGPVIGVGSHEGDVLPVVAFCPEGGTDGADVLSVFRVVDGRVGTIFVSQFERGFVGEERGALVEHIAEIFDMADTVELGG